MTSDADVLVSAKAMAFSAGKLTGLDHGTNGTINFSTSESMASATFGEAITQASAGAHATAEIDFTGKAANELVGTGFVLDGKKIDFYDSSQGAYKGDADFSIDLKGTGSSEAIVDKVVNALYNSTGTTVNGVSNNNSWLTNVNVGKSLSDPNKLVIAAKTSGTAGNSVLLADNSQVKVSNQSGNDKLVGESVVSAKGLEDGLQTVEVTYNAAKTNTIGTDGVHFDGGDSVSISSETTLTDGTYQLVAADAGGNGELKLQKMDSAGSFQDVAGYESFTLGSSGVSFKDLTISMDNDLSAAAINAAAKLTFSISQQHYSAKLTEANDSTAGTEVKFTPGQEGGFTLKANDGIGEATIKVDDIADSLGVGESTKFTFNTKAGALESEVVGGTFEASFQIGANSGQSMTIQINDMRSQALGVSGTDAAGTAMAKNGKEASFTKVESVTNGTNNDNVEFALDVSTHEKASAAISVINDAIESVSSQRSTLGAFQNRLEHTISNLNNSSENLQAAESRIRDVDMAKEVMEMTRANILGQASQAMLAQANQKPQSVMQLLG
ncbi:flagellin [Cytobacillus spongiae]|uniref:flagellin n=1 Tax=Cytobacillus spongiae TaxID=2901381 RepID=UPI003D7BE7C0